MKLFLVIYSHLDRVILNHWDTSSRQYGLSCYFEIPSYMGVTNRPYSLKCLSHSDYLLSL